MNSRRFSRVPQRGGMRSRKRARRVRPNRGRAYNPYLNSVPYCMSSKPTRYGPGQNISIINTIYTIAASTSYRIPIQTLLLGNTEFTAKKSYFRYFKIVEVRVCLFPSGSQSPSLIYLNLSWNAIQYTLDDIKKDDSTKITPVYRTRNKIFRWLPIRGVINVNSELQEIPTNFLDVSQFISTDRVVSLPGWLNVINEAAGTNIINIEIKVIFRANDFGDEAKKKIDTDLYNVKVQNLLEPSKRENMDIIYEEDEVEDIKIKAKSVDNKKKSAKIKLKSEL